MSLRNRSQTFYLKIATSITIDLDQNFPILSQSIVGMQSNDNISNTPLFKFKIQAEEYLKMLTVKEIGFIYIALTIVSQAWLSSPASAQFMLRTIKGNQNENSLKLLREVS